jgi:single-stranded DNA-binding protein
MQFKNDFNKLVDARVRNLVKQGREVIVVGDLVSSEASAEGESQRELTRGRSSAEYLPGHDRLRQPGGAHGRG